MCISSKILLFYLIYVVNNSNIYVCLPRYLTKKINDMTTKEKEYKVILNYFESEEDYFMSSKQIGLISEEEYAQRIYGDARYEQEPNFEDEFITYEEINK